jgi:uncharacterized DUF497 family protein
MKYEWDSLKAFKNIQKHGIDFAGAVIALEDEYALTIEDGSHNEQRFKTYKKGTFVPCLFFVMFLHYFY